MGPYGVRKSGQAAPENSATVVTVRTWKGPPRGPFPCAVAVQAGSAVKDFTGIGIDGLARFGGLPGAAAFAG